MTDSLTPIKVDIWSDIACPWCFIGKRKFEAGVEEFSRTSATPVEVEYHSFELAPDTPVDFDGSEEDFLAQHKGMSIEQLRPMLEQVTGVAASVGLDYHFDILKHTNTVLAHQALHFAKAHGKQLELSEALFTAYFTQGRHLGRIDTLVELGSAVGLDAEALRASLEGNEYLPAVRADQAQAQAFGIQGVPFFVVQGKYGVSGAQAPESFAQVLTQVDEELGDD
ncbi:DsbA family oxidoreductase [Mycetocola spongiae]|uniref:DsbA family oxidoreductase n=1 Tax=Mycetocola spongiae TaxID=2859226 RepID=UPI001CF507E3|nr:DsbA family oxidoreductase [Mycetocola spongiae]UCR89351.1 DsbA family oxidoreductase [Mycetocola spongiae]